MSKYLYDINKNITQGGILEGLIIPIIGEENEIKQINLKYSTVISQACDIRQSDKDNNYLPNIMILPMYIVEAFQAGEHLKDCGYSVQQRKIDTKEIEKLKRNSEHNRYHYLSKGEIHMKHDVIIDFKHYFTIPKESVINQYQEKYIATIDYLYRELLSQRFCNYLGRIGLP